MKERKKNNNEKNEIICEYRNNAQQSYDSQQQKNIEQGQKQHKNKTKEERKAKKLKVSTNRSRGSARAQTNKN